jgi:regulator of sirC expression with transglutaminase-like and TPR domain
VRLLNNLKSAYLRAGDDELALKAVDRLLVIEPGDHGEKRDRGLLLFRLHRYGKALGCLDEYLAAVPDAPDRATIEQHMETLRQRIASLN